MLYPINLKIDNMKITVVGGGKVAHRKCMNFLDFDKKVRVVSKDLIEDFDDIRNKIEIIEDNYKEKYIEDSFIVIAATNNKDINEDIGMYCKEHNKLVNVVDNIELCNFTVPSYIKRGDLVLSVSTGGKSPTLASNIRKKLEKEYDDTYEEYIKLLGEARESIIKNGMDIKIRREKIKNLVNLSMSELKKEVNKY